jgi:hypothetical protein
MPTVNLGINGLSLDVLCLSGANIITLGCFHTDYRVILDVCHVL